MAKDDKTKSRESRNLPISRIIGWTAGVLALVLLIVVIIQGTLTETTAGIPEGTQVFQITEQFHVDGRIYDDDEVPPGGNHSAVWANCGFYDTPVQAENVLHSLEHGAVWLTYQPDSITEDDLDRIEDLASPVEKVLVSPVPGQGSPLMATAWGVQLELQSTEDPRLDQFVAEFAGSLNAPEPGGTCSGGVGNPG